MKIAVNARLFLKNKMEGIGWFGYETMKRIVEKHPEHEFIFIFDRPYHGDFVFSKNIFPVVVFPPTRHPLLWIVWFELMLPFVLKKHKANLFVSPDGMLSLNTKVKSIAVIHDLNFIYHKNDLPFLVEKYYNFFFKKFAKKANRLATVSEYSKNDIIKNYGIDASKIDVVYNGANSIYCPIDEATKNAIKKEISSKCDYFIFIGAMHPRKNLVNLFKAFDLFKENTKRPEKLLIVGNKMYWREDIETAYNKMVHKSEVIFTGRLAPEKLKDVLGSALALTYVPYFEGFGIPIVEAFAAHVPVITSRITSMPEIAGDAAILIDPFSPEEISNAMTKIAQDSELRKALISKGAKRIEMFSWNKTSEAMWNCIEKVIKEI